MPIAMVSEKGQIAWALQAAYKQPNERILTAIDAIKALPGITLTDGDVVERAILIAKSSGQAFADAYVAALAEAVGADELATFNTKHFGRLGIPLHRF